MIWFLIKMLFHKTDLKKSLHKCSAEELVEMVERAKKEENYELAAFIEYYLKFKRFKNE